MFKKLFLLGLAVLAVACCTTTATWANDDLDAGAEERQAPIVAPPGYDFQGEDPVNPADTIAPPGYDFQGEYPVNPAETLAPRGADYQGEDAVVPDWRYSDVMP